MMTTPEFKECVNCGKEIQYVMGSCRNCGTERSTTAVYKHPSV